MSTHEQIREADDVAAAYRAQARLAQRRYLDALQAFGPADEHVQGLQLLHREALGQWKAAREHAKTVRRRLPSWVKVQRFHG